MPSTDSESAQLAAAVQRGVLGVLLAVVALVGMGLARQLLDGAFLRGGVGLLLLVGASYWLTILFWEGFSAR